MEASSKQFGVRDCLGDRSGLAFAWINFFYIFLPLLFIFLGMFFSFFPVYIFSYPLKTAFPLQWKPYYPKT